jgi:uncharacterized damage-inducible protein DinB
MTKTEMTKTFAALFFAGCAFAQGPNTVSGIFDGQLKTAESEIVSLVEAMPADKMNFAPTNGQFKGVRTFAEQAKHVSAVLYMVTAAANEEKPPVDIGEEEKGPASVKSKDEVVKFMKDAFAYAHKVMGTLTAENLTKMVKSPFGQGQMAKGAAASLVVWHTFDHYGQMVVYARMNGIVPPASR